MTQKKLPTSLERAKLAARVILDNHGHDVKIIDLRKITPAFDFFVIGSGSSRRQLHSISDEIDDLFEKELGDTRRSVSGYQESRWVVLDYGDVVVHLFEPETRDFYALEDLWGKGDVISFDADGSSVTIAAPEVEESETEDDFEDDIDDEEDEEDDDEAEEDDSSQGASVESDDE